MEIKIRSIHFDATEKLQAFINKKAEKLQKSFEDIQKVEVQLKVEKPRYVAQQGYKPYCYGAG